jgi:hypothetical protein
MPVYNRPPKQGLYKYVRLCEQLFFDDFSISHRDIGATENILKQIVNNLLSNSQGIGAGIFIVEREQVRVSTNGSSTLNIPCDGPGSDDDLKTFTEKSTPYDFTVSKL